MTGKRPNTEEQIYRLHDRNMETLESIGFAVQHIPRFCNTDSALAHGHDILEANFIVRGTALHRIEGKERRCGPGSLGITHYGESHCLATDEDGIEVINLYLDPARHALPDVPEDLSVMAGALFPPAPLEGMPRGLISFLHFQDPAPLTHLLLLCCTEQEERGTGYKASLESALRLILITCSRLAIAQGVETLVTDSSRGGVLEALRRKLERDFALPHRLEDMAEGAGMSEAHLCRIFKVYTGLSPFEYLLRRRIRAVMQELRNSPRRILEIAFAAGFGDTGYFNRKFKELAGCSPSQYRLRFRG